MLTESDLFIMVITFHLLSSTIINGYLDILHLVKVCRFALFHANQVHMRYVLSMLDTDVLLWTVCSKLKDENCRILL